MADVELHVGINGEAELKKSLGDLASEAKALKAEMTELKTNTSQFSTEEDRAKAIAEKLNEQIQNQESRVKLLNEKLEEAKSKYGDNSTQVSNLRTELANAKTVLGRMKTEQEQATSATEDNTEAVEDFAEATEDGGNGALTMGDMIKANLISDAIKNGLKKLAELAKEAAEALVSCATDAAAYADEILTMSTVTGLSTEQLQEFQYMSELVDVSVDTMTSSMVKLTGAMKKSRAGSKAEAEAFQKLGIRTTNADGTLRDSTEVFFEVIEALGQMEEGTERDALAMALFGKSAQELNPLIKAGKESIEAFAEEAHRMGFVLTDEELERLGELDDAMQRFELFKQTVRTRLGLAMAPAMERVLSKLTEFANRVDWEMVGEKLGGLLETLADKLIAWVEGVDFDALAEGAGKLLDGLIGGLTWIVEHADEIIDFAKQIAILLLGGKLLSGGKSALDFGSKLLGGGTKTATAAATSAATSGTGMGLGSTLLASGPLAAVIGGIVGGFWQGNRNIDEARARGTLGDTASAQDYLNLLKELEAESTRLREEYQALADCGADLTTTQNALDYNAFSLDSTLDGLADTLGVDREALGEYYKAWNKYRAALDAADAAQAAYEANPKKGTQKKLDAAQQQLTEAENALAAVIAESGIDLGDMFDTGSIEALPGEAYGWGLDVSSSFANGIDANSPLVRAAVWGVANLARAYLGHSEPDVGPMAHDSQWMPDMMQSLASGITANAHLVTDAARGLAFDLSDVLHAGSPGGAGVNYGGVNVVIYGADGQSADELYDVFSYRLQQDVLSREAVFA